METLSGRERLVLSACEFDAELPTKEIAKRIGLKEHNVAYVLRSLRARRLIQARPFVNPMALGYCDYGVYLSLASRQLKERKRIEERMLRSTAVAWLGKFAGEFQYGLALVARKLGEIEGFFKELEREQDGEIITRKVISPRLRFRLFPRKYLGPRSSPLEERVFGSLTTEEQIDEIDTIILKQLDALPEISLRQVAQNIGVSPSAVERRVADLKRRQILLGFFYDIDAKALGVEIYRLLVSWSGSSMRQRADLLTFCRAHPRVVFLNEEIGRWDYEIGIEATRAADVALFHEELAAHFGSSLADLSVMTEVSTLKWSFMPFI